MFMVFQNTCFYQNRTLLIKARELAAKKDIEALKELSDIEVCNFNISTALMKKILRLCLFNNLKNLPNLHILVD